MAKLEFHTIINALELTVIAAFALFFIFIWIQFIFVILAGGCFLLVMQHLEDKEKKEKDKEKQKEELRVVVRQIERENGLP